MGKVKVALNKLLGIKGNIYPSKHFLNIVQKLKENQTSINLAEIGVDRGATTKEIMKLLTEEDQYDLFDVENCKFFAESKKFNCKGKLIIHKNTTKIYDSYSWEIAKIIIENRTKSEVSLWDAVYIDGAHVFHVDAATTALVKENIKKGGYIVFDDMEWTLKSSPTCNTEFNKSAFTEEQMETPHVKLIVDALMKNDKRFIEIDSDDKSRSVFKKVN